MIKTICSICGATMEGEGPEKWPEFPFCSPRCKTIDLGRWLGEKYGLAKEEAGPNEESDSADEEAH